MNGEHEIPVNPIEKLAEYQQDSKLTSQANSTPLPGPLRDAFSPVPDIVVGNYKVRPMVDRDFEYLQILDHPLHKAANEEVEEKAKQHIADTIRGHYAWEACLMFTKPFKEVKSIITTKGPKGFKEQAADEFGELNLRDLIEVMKAIFEQQEIFWSCVIGHKSVDDESSKKNISVDGTEPQPMALAG